MYGDTHLVASGVAACAVNDTVHRSNHGSAMQNDATKSVLISRTGNPRALPLREAGVHCTYRVSATGLFMVPGKTRHRPELAAKVAWRWCWSVASLHPARRGGESVAMSQEFVII